MKPRGKILLAFAAVLLLAGFWFLFDHHGEPRYGGHPVSYWFREYCYSQTEQPYQDDDEERAQIALATIGTNAVPFLLEQALGTNDDTPVWKLMRSFYDDNFPHSHHRPRFVSQGESRDAATELIYRIRPPADLVLPRLREALNQTNTPLYEQSIAILQAIASPTNDSVALAPIFARALHDPDGITMSEATASLGDLGSNGLVAVPDLIAMLQVLPATNRTREFMARVLGNFGTNASSALPELRDIFRGETNGRSRATFAAAICKIDALDTEAFTYLTNCITNRVDNRLRIYAVSRLEYVGPRAASAIPALLENLSATNSTERSLLLDTLNSIGASTNVVINRVRQNLSSTNDEIRADSAAFILRLDTADKEAQGALVSLITNQSRSEKQAIRDLGKAGPAAKASIPIVLAVLDGTNSACWPSVPDALTNLGAPVSLFLSKIEEKLQPTHHAEFDDPSEIEQLARAALWFDPGNRDVQLTLLRFHDLEILGDANPAIAEVKTRLHEALASDSYYEHHTASAVLKKIEANEKKK